LAWARVAVYCTQFDVFTSKETIGNKWTLQKHFTHPVPAGSENFITQPRRAIQVNGKFHARIRHPASSHLSGPNNTDKLLTPGQFLRSIPFSKVQHRFIHHRSNASHHQEVRLNFKVIEGGVNVVGILKKITRRVFLAITTNPGGWSLTKIYLKIYPS